MIPFASGGLSLSLALPWTISLFAALFAASFFFSGTETALFSLQKVDRQRLATGSRTGRVVVAMLTRKGALITTLLIGNETANVLIAALGASVAAEHFPNAPWLNVVLLTPSLLLFSEITPKILAFRFNRRWATAVAWPLTGFFHMVTPVRWVVASAVGRMALAFQVTRTTEDDALDEAEIRTLVSEGAASGRVDAREREIIEAVFDFGDLTIGRLMTPRPDIVAVPLTATWREIIGTARTHRLSRIPVYDGRLDNVLGVLLVKDLLRYRANPPSTASELRPILLPTVFVPKSKSADDLLRAFMAKKFHMAMVADEHGTLVGLITLDDLLAELVGELLDDDDDDSASVTMVRAGVLAVPGDADVQDFTEETGIPVPAGAYHTLGGFVFHELGRLPQPGDIVSHEGVQFEVAAMEGRRITRVSLSGDLPLRLSDTPVPVEAQ